MADFVGAIDQGTTSTRFMIFDHSRQRGGPPPARARADPAAGRLGGARPARDLGAHAVGRPERRWTTPGLTASDLAALGITNQRETAVVWDRTTGRPLLQRDRLAGHPHRPHRLRAGPRRPRRRDPAQGRPAAGHLLLRRQDPVDPGERRRGPGGRRARRRDLRQHRHLAAVEPHRRHRRRGARHRPHQRQPHHADEPGDAGLGRRAARVLRHPALDAAGDQAELVPAPATAPRGPTVRSAARSRSPATSATSRPPPSGRSASPPARPRTPTAPATSCCSTPAPSWSARRPGC